MVVYNSRLTSPGDPERSRHFGYEAPCIRSIAPKQVQASSRTLDERHPCDVTETTSARVRAVNPPVATFGAIHRSWLARSTVRVPLSLVEFCGCQCGRDLGRLSAGISNR